MGPVTVPDDARRFVAAVRTRLDDPLAEAGLPLNGVYDKDAEPPNRNVSVLYEGVVSDFLARYPGLDPVWDEDWRKRADGCVDLWIKWSEAAGAIEVTLEHWAIRKLADRYGDESSVAAVEAALRGPGDMETRIEVIARILERSLSAASSR
jgi:hypothetical protein